MKNCLAIFDFDKTITDRDTLTDFIRFQAGRRKFYRGLAANLFTLILYVLKLVPNYTAKEKVLVHFFSGMPEKDMIAAGDSYAVKRLPAIIAPQALERIKYHREQGHKLVIVSASPVYWYRAWAEENGFSEIISTELEISDGKLTGKLSGGNCYGPEKVQKLKNRIDTGKFDCIYAYGDSSGDRELLAMADEAYLKYKRLR
ncbi:MAG: HAD family hydrolase [Syntrophothermus sp.]